MKYKNDYKRRIILKDFIHSLQNIIDEADHITDINHSDIQDVIAEYKSKLKGINTMKEYNLLLELVDNTSKSKLTDILDELKEYNPLISVQVQIPCNVNIKGLCDDLYTRLENIDVQYVKRGQNDL